MQAFENLCTVLGLKLGCFFLHSLATRSNGTSNLAHFPVILISPEAWYCLTIGCFSFICFRSYKKRNKSVHLPFTATGYCNLIIPLELMHSFLAKQ